MADPRPAFLVVENNTPNRDALLAHVYAPGENVRGQDFRGLTNDRILSMLKANQRYGHGPALSRRHFMLTLDDVVHVFPVEEWTFRHDEEIEAELNRGA